MRLSDKNSFFQSGKRRILVMRINNNLLLICPRLLTSWFINIGEMSAPGHFRVFSSQDNQGQGHSCSPHPSVAHESERPLTGDMYPEEILHRHQSTRTVPLCAVPL